MRRGRKYADEIRTLSHEPAFRADEAEMAVIGSLIVAHSQGQHKPIIREIADSLRPEMFFRPIHQALFAICLGQWQAGEDPDLVTVRAQAVREGVPGFDVGLLVQIAESSSSPQNGPHYAQIVRDAYIRRTLHQRLGDVARKATNAEYPVSEVLADADCATAGLHASGGLMITPESVDLTSDAGLRGVPTGYSALDRLIVDHGGWPASHTSFVCAKTGVGKTAFMIGAAMNALDLGHSVGFATFEMTPNEIVRRMLLATVGLSKTPAALDRLPEWDDAVRSVQWEPLYFFNPTRSGRCMEDVAEWAFLARERKGIGVLFIDYCQLLRLREPGYMKGHEQHAEISKQLKSLAVDLDIPLVVGAQINDDGTIRGSRDYLFDSSLRLELERDQGATKGTLYVKKNRVGRAGVSLPVEFDDRHAQYREAS